MLQFNLGFNAETKTHKNCTKCGELKALSEFYAHKAMRDGKRPECKVCTRKVVMDRYNDPEIKDRILARRRAEYAKPEIRTKVVAKLAEYRARPGNAELAIERSRAWRSEPENLLRHTEWCTQYRSIPENKQRASKKRSMWQKANPEGVRAHRHKRRAMKRASPGSHTRAEIEALLVSQNYHCASCESDLRIVKRHLDHWMPLILGGSNSIENLQWLCGPCNLHKKSKDPIDWLVRLGKASFYPKRE